MTQKTKANGKGNNDELAQAIASLGLVTRQGSRFMVKSPTLQGGTLDFEVWRDEAGKVRCSCLENDEHGGISARCEHILSVKHALAIEMAGKQPLNGRAETADNSKPAGLHLTNCRMPEFGINDSVEAANSEGQSADFGSQLKQENGSVDVALDSSAVVKSPATESAETVRKFAVGQEAIQKGKAFVRGKGSSESESALKVPPLQFSGIRRVLNPEEETSPVVSPELWAEADRIVEEIEVSDRLSTARVLDLVSPSWSHSVRAIQLVGNMVVVTASITIDGVTREGIGTDSAESKDGLHTAEDEAIKNAAHKFGIDRLQADSSAGLIGLQPAPMNFGYFPFDPIAISMAELVTPRQLGMIQALSRESEVDADQECVQLLRCKTEELSKRAASYFIDYLRSLPLEKAGRFRRVS